MYPDKDKNNLESPVVENVEDLQEETLKEFTNNRGDE